MPNDEMQMIIKMAEDIAGIKATLQTMSNTNEVAIKAMDSARSAHHRIDDLKNNEIRKLEENQTWLWRTVIGGLLAGAISILWKVMGK